MIPASGKTGLGVDNILRAIIDKIPSPKGTDEASTDIAVDGKESCETNEPLAKPRLGMYFPIIGSSPSSDLDNNDPSVNKKVERVGRYLT